MIFGAIEQHHLVDQAAPPASRRSACRRLRAGSSRSPARRACACASVRSTAAPPPQPITSAPGSFKAACLTGSAPSTREYNHRRTLVLQHSGFSGILKLGVDDDPDRMKAGTDNLVVSSGSSASTVSTPTIIARCRCRSVCVHLSGFRAAVHSGCRPSWSRSSIQRHRCLQRHERQPRHDDTY